jgi:hypothetical protein
METSKGDSQRLVIGIPTRNRAQLAMAAIDSVLRSDAGVDLVVSDNSTQAAERDRLAEFCASKPAGAVEYVRPPEPLSMAAHWEWFWKAIEETIAPTHLAYLTDRLVFREGALAELAEIVRLNPDSVVSYHWDRVHDRALPVELQQTQWSGKLLELDSRKLIELSSLGVFPECLPRLMNSFAPVSVISAIERRFGDVFGDVSPDYRFAYRCLAVRDSVLYLDRACVIEHGFSRSAGGNYVLGSMNDDATWFAQELDTARFGATPEPAFETGANAILQEYCSVRAELNGDGFPPVDERGYLVANAISADRLEDPRWRARTSELLRRRGWTRWSSIRHVLGLTREMAGFAARHPGVLPRSIRRQVRERPPGTVAAYVLPRIGLNPRIGPGFRFDSSEEAIAHANENPRPRMATTWPVHRLARAGAVVRNLR